MKALLRLGSSFLIVALFCSFDKPAPPEGFRAIFNGKDLSGWYGLNPHAGVKLEGEKKAASLKQQREDFAKHWSIENGELVNIGTGPYATTEEAFGDIEFLIEYKTVAKADSGIYMRGAPQIQIWDHHQVFDPAKPDRKPHLAREVFLTTRPTLQAVILWCWQTSLLVSGISSASARSAPAPGSG